MDHQSRPQVRAKKRGRDRLVRLSATRPHWMLVWEDECWFSRFAQPSLSTWSREGKPLALEQKEPSKKDQEAKAVACYGAVEAGTGQVRLRFSPGQPNSGYTLEFLKYLLRVAEEKGKQALLVIWDNASWHKSKEVREWVKGHNHQVKQEGGVRLLTCCLSRVPG